MNDNTIPATPMELEQKIEQGYIRDLLFYPNFVCWRREYNKDGNPTKPPYNPRTFRYADPSDPETWGTYKDALNALKSGLFQGFGFVLSPADPFTAIDLDDCAHYNRQINKREQEYIQLITLTLNHVPGTPMMINYRQKALDKVLAASKSNLPLDTKRAFYGL